MAEPELKPLPPAEAIAFFKAKGLATSFDWPEVWQEEHAHAFTVAKMMRRDLLETVKGALERAIEEGTTLEAFKRDLAPLLAREGWWGRKEMIDPLTGEARVVQLGSPRRLRTIFEVNLRSAYAAGRWERAQATKTAVPLLRYVAVQDGRTRPEHRAWHGTLLPIDDPWWDTHYPPCGWRCRCQVQQLTRGQAERRGWSVTPTPPRGAPRPWRNPRTGEVVIVETGIDPGFGFNVGKARSGGLAPRLVGGAASEPRATGTPDPLPEPRYGPEPLAASADRDAAERAFLFAFGASRFESVVFTDRGGEPFVAAQTLFRTAAGKPAPMAAAARRALPLAAAAVRYPDEIRWVWTGGRRDELVRRYVARLKGRDAEHAVVVDVGRRSFRIRSSLGKGFDLQALRTGAVAWRRTGPDQLDVDAGERRALETYTGAGYAAVNRYLRQGLAPEGEAAQTIAALDGLLGRSRLPQAMTLYRAVAGEFVEDLEAAGLGVGQILPQAGYTSASRDPKVASRFEADDPNAMTWMIRARAGDRALDVTELSATPHEHEILFARGLRLRVLGWDDDARILQLETTD